MNKVLEFLKSLLSNDEASCSSKRLFGGIGFLVSTGIVIYCTVVGKQAPDIMEFYMICSVSLLGLDSITNIWKKKK